MDLIWNLIFLLQEISTTRSYHLVKKTWERFKVHHANHFNKEIKITF